MKNLATYLGNVCLVQRTGLICRWDQNGCRVWGRFVWDEIEAEEPASSLDAHAKVFQTEIFAILGYVKDCRERNYTGQPGRFKSP
jgi:hypothetical protein